MNPNRTVFMRSFSIALLASTIAVSGLASQTPTAAAAPAQRTSLTLSEALQIAERNNPTYQQSINGRARARAGLRTAYGTLFPSVDASVGASYREGRQQFFGGVPIGASVDIVSSSWSLQASTRYAWGTISNIKRANASLDAAEADLNSALFTLRSERAYSLRLDAKDIMNMISLHQTMRVIKKRLQE
jgi:outer membrane protein TolC